MLISTPSAESGTLDELPVCASPLNTVVVVVGATVVVVVVVVVGAAVTVTFTTVIAHGPDDTAHTWYCFGRAGSGYVTGAQSASLEISPRLAATGWQQVAIEGRGAGTVITSLGQPAGRLTPQAAACGA